MTDRVSQASRIRIRYANLIHVSGAVRFIGVIVVGIIS